MVPPVALLLILFVSCGLCEYSCIVMDFDYKDAIGMESTGMIPMEQKSVQGGQSCYFYMRHNYSSSVQKGIEQFDECLKSPVGHFGAGIFNGKNPHYFQTLPCSITSEYSVCFCEGSLCNAPENWTKIMSNYLNMLKSHQIVEMRNRDIPIILNTADGAINVTGLQEESAGFTKCSIKLKSLMREERFDEKFNKKVHVTTNDPNYDSFVTRSKKEASTSIAAPSENKGSKTIIGIVCFVITLLLFPISIVLTNLSCKRLLKVNTFPKTKDTGKCLNLFNTAVKGPGKEYGPKKGNKAKKAKSAGKKEKGGKKDEEMKKKKQQRRGGQESSYETEQPSTSVTGDMTTQNLEGLLSKNMN